MDKDSLRERAVARGLATWKPLDPVDLAVNELADQEETLNLLGRDSIRQGITAIDEAANFAAGLRDQLFELDLMSLDQEKQIALNRYLTEKQVLALHVAGELLLLAAKEYDAQVQGIIMDAREYAATIDREGIELQKQRALMDMRKEEAHFEEVRSRILLELVERRNQEIELARAKVEVARANVRAVLADIQAQEAEVRLIRAELEIAEAEADKAGLIADVAMILADIVTRGLARIRLAVETAELGAAFTFIAQSLEDLLAIAAVKLNTEEIRLAYEKLLHSEVALLEEAQERQIDLEKLRMAMLERLQDFEQERQRLADLCARTIKNVEQAHKEALAQVRSDSEVELDKMRTWAEMLVNGAQATASRFQEIREFHTRHYGQKIIKGTYIAGGGGASFGTGTISSLPPQTVIPDVSVSDQQCSQEEPYL